MSDTSPVRVERIVVGGHAASGRGLAYEAGQLRSGKTLIYVEQHDRCHVGLFARLDIEMSESCGRANIELALPEGGSMSIPGRLERAPYGFDGPVAYDIVVAPSVEMFELLGDCDELRRKIRKERTLNEAISKFTTTL